MTGVDEHSPQQGSLLLVFGRVQGWQDEGLGRLQGILQGLERRYEDGGPLLLGAAGAAVAVSGRQARQAGDGVEMGLVGAHPGQRAERGQGGHHGEPGSRSREGEREPIRLHLGRSGNIVKDDFT